MGGSIFGRQQRRESGRPAVKRFIPIADRLAKQVFGNSGAPNVNWRNKGDALRGAKRWSEAAAAYVRHLARVPGDTAIWIQLGHMLKEAGELRQALDAYERSEVLDSEDADRDMHLTHLRRRMVELAHLQDGRSIDRDGHGASESSKRSFTPDSNVAPGLDGYDGRHIAAYLRCPDNQAEPVPGARPRMRWGEPETPPGIARRGFSSTAAQRPLVREQRSGVRARRIAAPLGFSDKPTEADDTPAMPVLK